MESLDDQLGWGKFMFQDLLAPMDATEPKELGASQFTQASPLGTQHTQLPFGWSQAVGGATEAGPTGRAIPAGARSSLAVAGSSPVGGATLAIAGSSQATMAKPSPDELGPRVTRAPNPLTYDRDHTRAGARATRAKRSRRI